VLRTLRKNPFHLIVMNWHPLIICPTFFAALIRMKHFLL
jgi:hypothetical protein